MSRTVLNIIHLLPLFNSYNLRSILLFNHEEMEAQRGLETCLKAHSYEEAEPGFNLR